MINPFHINVTLGKWLFNTQAAPIEIVNEKNKPAQIDPTKVEHFAHQAALLDAYPDYIEDLGTKVANNLHTIIRSDPDYATLQKDGQVSLDPSLKNAVIRDDYKNDLTPNSDLANKEKHDKHSLSVFETQLEHLHIPIWSLPSHIQYLFSRFYYAMALRVMKRDSSPMWAIPLFISWALYRVVDATRFVVGLVFSPVPFTLTLVLRGAVAGARLVGTWGHYVIANAVNSIANFISNRGNPTEKNENVTHKYFTKKRSIRTTDFDKDTGDIILREDEVVIRDDKGNPNYIAEQIQMASPTRLQKSHLHKNKLMNPPDLLDAWRDFAERLKSAWKDSKAYVRPIQRKIEHVINPMHQKSKTNTLWFAPIAFFAALVLTATAFFDFVAVEAIMRISKNRPLDTQFFDMIGGGYAEIAWKHIASWGTIAGNAIAHGAIVAWENISHATQFFGYFLTQHAFAFGLSSLVIALAGISYFILKENKNNQDDRIHISNTVKQGWELNIADNKTSLNAQKAMMFTTAAPVVKAAPVHVGNNNKCVVN